MQFVKWRQLYVSVKIIWIIQFEFNVGPLIYTPLGQNICILFYFQALRKFLGL